jgi:hypothetical protein
VYPEVYAEKIANLEAQKISISKGLLPEHPHEDE